MLVDRRLNRDRRPGCRGEICEDFWLIRDIDQQIHQAPGPRRGAGSSRRRSASGVPRSRGSAASRRGRRDIARDVACDRERGGVPVEGLAVPEREEVAVDDRGGAKLLALGLRPVPFEVDQPQHGVDRHEPTTGRFAPSVMPPLPRSPLPQRRGGDLEDGGEQVGEDAAGAGLDLHRHGHAGHQRHVGAV